MRSLRRIGVFASLLVCGISFAATQVDTSRGPAPAEEAPILFETGRQAFGRGDYRAAIQDFQRLVDRHPGTAHYLDSKLLLGISYLRQKEPEKAKRPLQDYIEATHPTGESFRARLNLGRAYLDTREFKKALLVAIEFRNHQANKKTPGIPAEVYKRSLILKAWSLMGLDRDLEARQALDSYFNQSEPKLVNTEAHYATLEMKLKECARLPQLKPVEEGILREQLMRRGRCLLEASNIFHTALKEENVEEWLTASREALSRAFTQYGESVQNPPPPPGDRTAIEIQRYRAELKGLLNQDFAEFRTSAVDLFQAWQKKLPSPLHYHLEKLIEGLK